MRAHRTRSVAAYGCACVIATFAMLVSATNEHAGTDSDRATDVLQGLVVVIEVSSLGIEAFQLVSPAHLRIFCVYIIILAHAPPVDVLLCAAMRS